MLNRGSEYQTRGGLNMFTGMIIDDLIATVERAEQHASLVQLLKPEQSSGLSLVASNANVTWENWAGVA
jgi:hypothetical protein